MGSNYDYTYDYDVNNSNKQNRTARSNNTAGNYTHRTAGNQSNYAPSSSTFGRASNMDPLVNLQHDRIWHKLYDPTEIDKSANEAEAQVCR